MDENDTVYNQNDGFKWVVAVIGLENYKGKIYTDMIDVCKHIGISESTIIRRLKQSKKNYFNINGYTITKMPYYKSKRGTQPQKGVKNE